MLLSLLSRRTLEVDSRDSYGFALRPQHIQRYKENIGIYKEEEEERSFKWKIFLENQVQPDKVISSTSEEDDEETEQAEETQSILEESKECGDSRSESGDSTYCESRTEAQVSEKDKEEDQLPGLHEEQVQPLEEPKEDNVHVLEDSEKETRQQKQIHEEIVKEDNVRVLKDPEKETREQEEIPEKKEELCDEAVKEAQGKELSERPSGISEETKDQPLKEAVKEAQGKELSEKPIFDETKEQPLKEAQGKELSEKPLGISEETKEQPLQEPGKTKEVYEWMQIRPSLSTIEHLMSFRVKKSKNMKEDRISADGICLPPINEIETEGLEEVQFLVHGGVPKNLRGEVWQAFVGVKARRRERYYEEMLAKDISNDDSNRPANCEQTKWKRQIEKDIPRTFPGHPALNDNGRESLKRILVAYAQHNPTVGYCQAMNFFAGILLLLMPEENAFWTLVGIIDDYFEGCYTEEMIESQVDQLVFEELMRERFPKLVNHLDYLGVQVAWISGPWFLSIFVNLLPWESVLRIWDVLLFEGNRVMLFRTALALMELYGPSLVSTKDAGDAITMLQNLTGSTFDSSLLVLTACMGYLSVNEARLQELREKHRPSILKVIEERTSKGPVSKDSKALATKLYSFKHDRRQAKDEPKTDKGDEGADPLPDLQEQVVWMKVELCKLLEEKRSAMLRAEELETALVEMAQEDNRLQLNARMEELEKENAELKQTLEDKTEHETAMLQVLMRLEQEQRIAEEARRSSEREAAVQKCAVRMLEEKYEKAMGLVAQMEKKAVMAESMLEATMQYENGQAKASNSPRCEPGRVRPLPSSGSLESPRRGINLLPFRIGWRDRGKTRLAEESGADPASTPKQTAAPDSEPR